MADVRAASQSSRAVLTLGNSNSNSGGSSSGGDYMSSVALSDDGQWLAAGGGSGVVGVWHASTQRIATSLAHSNAIGTVKFVPRGAVGQRDGEASASGGATIVTTTLGGASVAQWRIDGALHATATTASSCLYALAFARQASYHALAVAGSTSLIEVFFGTFERVGARFTL